MKPSPLPPSPLERLRAHLVGLKMARALEVLETLVSQLEPGQLTALEALERLLAEEHTQRETRRIRMALITARLTQIKTLESFDFNRQCGAKSKYQMGSVQVVILSVKMG
jgi:DNA replication protein DnaC